MTLGRVETARRIASLFLLIIIVAVVVNYASEPDESNFNWTQESKQNDWEIALPKREGFMPIKLIELHENVKSNSAKKVQSLLIVRNGKLIFEHYYLNRSTPDGTPMPDPYPPSPDTFHHMKSVTKTVTATLIANLLLKNEIESIDTSIFSYYSAEDIPDLDSKKPITIRHALDFNSGISWSEWGVDNSDAMNMWLAEDPYEYIFNKNIAYQPDEKFVYQGAMSVLLGGLIENVTGSDLQSNAHKILFEPLNIVNYYWFPHERTGDYLGSSGLYLRSRDLAKLGLLYLNKGIWGGKRIFSEQWAGESLVPKGKFWNERAIQYGHNWWFPYVSISGNRIDIAGMRGSGGQDMFIIPDYKLIVLTTAGAYGHQDEDYPLELIVNYILPSLGVENASYKP
ncbi:serine hydrolase domain-containing protein [Vibrio nomapromontoriensis]|uniref:serine hydrolase domain-containing protein n=1 Tax=Vibrio nomapromontoriensis TaxID=2910246 RepID=UPI003D0F0293